ncbi:hypothetical protein F4821DRAFT_133670 [Hypoxylon rubiginosum]|uniref:Uncharacterized protein n=1 Tax=Hypoxylon rubiginosum TaxID=110542 RepID=A0ACC0DHX3_9PEZI|nr:hypothetical protein F4821DRAFT_133670 [Hypoxylon rubiginosum]
MIIRIGFDRFIFLFFFVLPHSSPRMISSASLRVWPRYLGASWVMIMQRACLETLSGISLEAEHERSLVSSLV